MGKRRRSKVRMIVAASVAVILAVFGAALALTLTAPKADMAAVDAYNSAHATLPAQKFVPAILYIGDSYTGGSDMGGYKEFNWTSVVAAGITKTGQEIHTDVLPRGGAGYFKPGQVNETFGQALAKSNFAGDDVIVVFGSINDSDQPVDKVGAAARDLYAELKKRSPNAKLIIVGPAWPHTVAPANMLLIKDELKADATAAGATFVDPIVDGWFRGDFQRLIGTDGTHPTNEGHAYMAGLLLPVIQDAVAKSVAAHK